MRQLAEIAKATLTDAEIEEAAEEFRKAMAPAGGIPGLSPLLDARRLEWAIHDDAFKLQAAFDVCLVHQVPRFAEKYGDTSIWMPDSAKRRVSDESPRGILVSAGLHALDCLRSNGIEPGHLVSFIRQAPWRMPVAMFRGKEKYLMILRAGDITGSEDLRVALAKGECRAEWDEEKMEHFYVDQQGKRWTPKMPFIGEDY